MQRHLDCGKHVQALESETMLDKAVRGYAVRLEGQFKCAMVWRGHHKSRGSRLTVGIADGLGSQTDPDKQKEYLTNKFLIRETTGQKANPVHVARSMMTARDETGKRMFSSAEFLTAKQIMSFFSRLAAFSVNLCLRPWTNFWVNEENYHVTVCGQSNITFGENARLCRFSIVTVSLYLNNVFGDI